MPEQPIARKTERPSVASDLDRALVNARRKWHAREIHLRYLPKPALNRWIAEALIEHHLVIEKIRSDMASGELTLHNIESLADKPIARGVGDTASDAVTTMQPLVWRHEQA